ncbi:hypothetical protein AMELA_G00030480 [Ameiurus melas]|uniref:Uncharacterized protein n=1 Tax=Ameiurus melas TaxID=219545 RepID=A0A7J6B6Y7_AMEME|nr:hypothetical protein AMELA_G00030480 [Ameiurus melas]
MERNLLREFGLTNKMMDVEKRLQELTESARSPTSSGLSVFSPTHEVSSTTVSYSKNTYETSHSSMQVTSSVTEGSSTRQLSSYSSVDQRFHKKSF